jgi:DNA-binding transcriptional regulator YdaS (Cro superfamily)
MDLREYMFRNHLTSVEVAKRLECSRQLVTMARSGKRVSRRFAKDIERMTGGQVTIDEITCRKEVLCQN